MLNRQDLQNLHWCNHNLHFLAYLKSSKNCFFGQVIFAQITPHHCTFVPRCIKLPVWRKLFLPESIKRSKCTLLAFYARQKTQTSYQCFCVRGVNYCSPAPQGHTIRCKNWAWPQHGFLISFRAKTRLILLVMSSPSRSAVAERAACGRE